MTKNKNKKTLLAFLMGIAIVYGAWNSIQNISKDFSIPIPILALIMLIIYLVWTDKDISE
jgi:putative effector of murein hydrolase LrgA (UPF0299 family)